MVREKTQGMEETLKTLSEQMKLVLDKMDRMEKRFVDQEKRFEKMEKQLEQCMMLKAEIGNVKSENLFLKNKLLITEKALKETRKEKQRKKVDIVGVPRLENEVLSDIVINMANKGKLAVEHQDISEVFRRKDTPKGPGTITVKFRNRSIRDNFLNKVKISKPSTKSLGFKDVERAIYVNDSLLPETKTLLYKASQVKNQLQWAKVWIYSSEVYVRREEKGGNIRLESVEDLEALLC